MGKKEGARYGGRGKRAGSTDDERAEKKRKMKKQEAEDDDEEEEQQQQQQQEEEEDYELVENTNEDVDAQEEDDEDDEDEEEGGEKQEKKQGKVRKVIVVLDDATIEAVKTSRGHFELLNCDDHLGLHKKLKRDPSRSRPDIAHQMLLTLLDSPLNKAGHLEIYLRTNKNVLIKVSPHLRIPRTFKRFAGLMVQLLHKMKIRAVDGNKTLLKIIKNPITRHLPPNARIFAADVSGALVDVHEFVPALDDTTPVVYVFGAFAHGDIKPDYAETLLSFSEYPLSGACAVGRLVGAYERKWGII